MNTRTVLDSIMHKYPSTRKYYRVSLIVPDNGVPVIEYSQAISNSKKPKKSLQFVDLLFADKKHDTDEKFAFSIYTTDKTVTFLAKDDTTMNEWLTKIRDYHSNIYPDFKRYDAIFEANLLEKGLAKTMNIHGQYRLALCKDSLDLVPLLTTPQLLAAKQLQQQQQANAASSKKLLDNDHHGTKLPNTNHIFQAPTSTTMNPLNSTSAPQNSASPAHHHMPVHLPSHQRFNRRHPLLSSKTVELALRSIRRCGHTHNSSNFYIESGRHSQIGEGDLWMNMSKKSVARKLHELLLATMKLASATEDHLPYKAPRSRSGSSSENANRAQQSRSSSLICLSNDSHSTNFNNNNNSNNMPATMINYNNNMISNNNNINNNNNNNICAGSTTNNASIMSNGLSTSPGTSMDFSMLSSIANSNSQISSSTTTATNIGDDDGSGYLPMA